MAFIGSNGGRIHYRVDGAPDASSATPWVVLSNSLGTNLSMWDSQVEPLLKHFRVLRYDTRGMGRSSVTPGPYTNGQLATDVLRLLDTLQIERAHFCGLSMGGMAGMRLGTMAPERIGKLVLCSTGARIGSAEQWKSRIDTVLEKGMEAVTDTIIARWFTQGFLQNNPSVIKPIRQMLLDSSPEGYVSCSVAVRDTDERESVRGIRAPTLVISGRHDPATPPSDGQFLAANIPGAQYVELEGSHLSNVECAADFNRVLVSFLTDL